MINSLPYIAGFFDGEGSIGIYPRKDRKAFFLKTQLAQNKSTIVTLLMSRLMQEFGGNCSPQPSMSGKIKYNWQLSGNKAVYFLRKILPHLIIKKEQAKIAIKWQTSRPAIIRNSRGQIQQASKIDVHEHLKVSQILKSLKG